MAITAAEYEARLSLNAKDFQGGMKTAEADFSGFKSKISGVCGVIGKTLTAAIGTATTAIGGLATYSASVGKDFESSMSQVAAVMGISAEEIEKGSGSFEKLKAAAQEAGATTKYSASEAGDALQFLALAGYDADKACEALPTVLNIAQAGALELADASDMVTDSMAALNIEATKPNLEHFGDQLAKTASKSNTSVAQLGEAILTVGGTANYLKGGTDELNTALGIMANNGIKGAESGTKLRNIILSLSAPTDTAKEEIEGLGLSCEDLQDADGNLLPLNEIMIKLNDSMSELSQTEKANVLNSIFNKTDLAAVNALLKDSGQSWDDLNANIKDCDGACQQMADTMANNLEGQIASAKSAAEGFGIALYDKMQKPLTDIVKTGTQSIRDLTKAFQEGGVDKLIEVGSKMFADLFSQILSYAPKVLDMAISLIKSFVKGIADNSKQIADAAMSIVSVLVEGIGSLLPMIVNAGALILTNLINAIAAQLPTLIPIAVKAITDFAQALVDNLPMLITAALQLIQALAEGILNALPDFINSVFEIITALQDTIFQALPQILEVGTQILVALLQGLIDNLPLIMENTQKLMQNLMEGIRTVMPQLLDLTMQLVQAVAEVIMQTDWIALGKQIITMLLESIGSMLDTAIDVALNLGDTIYNTIESIDFVQLGKDIIDYIINGIKALADTFFKVGEDVGGKLFEKIESIDWVGLGKGILTFIKQGIETAATLILYAGKAVFGNMFNTIKSIDWKMLGSTILETIKNGLSSVASNLLNAAKIAGTNALNGIKSLLWGDTGKEIMRKIVSGLTSMISNLLNTARDIFNKAKEAFNNVSFLEIGKNAVRGIIDGVTNAATALYDSLKNLAKNALQAAKDFLGIHSPSKEFAKIGKNIIEGWKQPIEDDNSLSQAITDTAEDALQSARNGLDEYNNILDGYQSTKRNIKINADIDNGTIDNVKFGSSFIGGMGALFDSFTNKNTGIFNGLKTNIRNGNTSSAQNHYIFNLGNNVYNISGVLDKDAAEQVRDIADNQINEFADMVATYIPV